MKLIVAPAAQVAHNLSMLADDFATGGSNDRRWSRVLRRAMDNPRILERALRHWSHKLLPDTVIKAAYNAQDWKIVIAEPTGRIVFAFDHKNYWITL